MKKVIVSMVLTASVAAMLMTGCGSSSSQSASSQAASTETAADDGVTKSEGVQTYAEYAAAASDGTADVTVETYVQAKQGWWENEGVGTATLYTQDAEGGYFIYNLPIEKEDYDKLVEGQKIKVSGTKAEWSGEVEIIDATYEIEDGNYIAEAVDVTDKLSADDLIEYQNRKVKFTGLTVEAAGDGDAAFLYNWDGSGSQGDDLYFNVSDGNATYSFTVESYLCGSDTDVYKAVEALQVGDVIDAEGFLYWYEGANPHITSVTVK